MVCYREIDVHNTKAHHNLAAWQVARELVKRVYILTRTFPREELFVLTIQVRRAAISIPSNIAEGAARTGPREFAHFLNVARGSLSELETQLLIASDLAYLSIDDPIFDLTDRASRLITGLHKATSRNRARIHA